MGMTEQLEKIALEVAAEMPCCMNHVEIEDGVRWSKSELISFAERFLAALPKPKPFGYVYASVSEAFDSVHCGTIYSLNADDGRIPLYSEPVIAPPATEQTNTGHEDTERLNYLIKSGRTLIESKGWFFTYNHTSGRSGPAKETPRAAIDASMDEKGSA